MSSLLVRGVKLSDPIKIDKNKWKLMNGCAGDSVFIKDIAGEKKFRYRLADVSNGKTTQIKGRNGTIIESSDLNICSNAPLANGDIVCLTADGRLMVFDPVGNLIHKIQRKGSMVVTHGTDIILLEDGNTVRFLDPSTFEILETIRLKEKVTSLLPVSIDLLVATQRNGTNVTISHRQKEGSKTRETTITTVPSDNIIIKKCLGGKMIGKYELHNAIVSSKCQKPVWFNPDAHVILDDHENSA